MILERATDATGLATLLNENHAVILAFCSMLVVASCLKIRSRRSSYKSSSANVSTAFRNPQARLRRIPPQFSLYITETPVFLMGPSLTFQSLHVVTVQPSCQPKSFTCNV